MRSENIAIETITATVQARTRRTVILEAQYRQALVKAYPAIADFEQAQSAIAVPAGKLEGDALAVTTRQFLLLQKEYALGSALAAQVETFVLLLARITALDGAPVCLTGHQFSDADVVAAFENWLDTSEEGFWAELAEAVARLNTPLTPITAQPPEALTKAQKTDPLSDAPASAGNVPSSGGSMPSSSASASGKRRRTATRTTASSTP